MQTNSYKESTPKRTLSYVFNVLKMLNYYLVLALGSYMSLHLKSILDLSPLFSGGLTYLTLQGPGGALKRLCWILSQKVGFWLGSKECQLDFILTSGSTPPSQHHKGTIR